MPRPPCFATLGSLLLLPLLACAQSSESAATATAGPAPGAPIHTEFGYGDATVLGLVEGITEFLPISSTGHLILANHLLGLNTTTPALDREGRPLWVEAPDPASGTPGHAFTVKDAADTYTVAIQIGAIAAVALLYRERIGAILRGLMGRDAAGLRLVRNLFIACVPAAAIGLPLSDWIDATLFNPLTVAAALIVGAVIMVAADRRQRALAAHTPDLDPADLSVKQSLLIGLMQCGALWPGMSRSMMTIVGGCVVGLRPARAAEFSFLLGLPTLGGAALIKSLQDGDLTLAAFGPGPLAWGALVAAISAAFAVAWLVRFLNHHGLMLFAWYRVALAVIVLALFQL